MKYDDAKSQFKHALDNQQTIKISKLSKLMQSMNMTLNPSRDVEVQYLKGEIKKLRKAVKR